MVIGEIADVTRAGGGYTGFHRSVRLFARLDAVEEILHVGDGAITVASLCKNRILPAGNAFAMDRETTAIDLQSRFSPAKFKAPVIDGRTHHAFVDHVESRIAEGSLNGVWTIPLIENALVRKHHSVLGLICLHCPMHHVDPVREKVGHGAAAKIPEPAPMDELLLIE